MSSNDSWTPPWLGMGDATPLKPRHPSARPRNWSSPRWGSDATFKEEEHDRDKGGKFTSGGAEQPPFAKTSAPSWGITPKASQSSAAKGLESKLTELGKVSKHLPYRERQIVASIGHQFLNKGSLSPKQEAYIDRMTVRAQKYAEQEAKLPQIERHPIDPGASQAKYHELQKKYERPLTAPKEGWEKPKNDTHRDTQEVLMEHDFKPDTQDKGGTETFKGPQGSTVRITPGSGFGHATSLPRWRLTSGKDWDEGIGFLSMEAALHKHGLAKPGARTAKKMFTGEDSAIALDSARRSALATARFLITATNRAMHYPKMAFDRALVFSALASQTITIAMDQTSVRTFSPDGHLHVALSNISRASVNPYFGKEIPDSEKLGLDPNRKYMLLRHPDELRKAAQTFNGIPVLIDHRPISADDHPQNLVVGTTGTDARYEHPFLQNSLHIWSKPAIDAIQNNERRELSCAYHYVPIMKSGVYEGKTFDGIMSGIHGNHVALVESGRVGPAAIVADAMPSGL